MGDHLSSHTTKFIASYGYEFNQFQGISLSRVALYMGFEISTRIVTRIRLDASKFIVLFILVTMVDLSTKSARVYFGTR